MNVWSKLLTAMRGTAYEAGEAVVDSQALRILDQEIRDADAELHKSREALANIMAKQKLAAEKTSKVAAKITEYERYAIKALGSGNEPLALEVAEKIASLRKQCCHPASCGKPSGRKHQTTETAGRYGEGDRQCTKGTTCSFTALWRLSGKDAYGA